MDFAASKIYAYYRRPYRSELPVINVFEFRRVSKPGKQETWSYLPLPKIVILMIDFKRIKQMQYTEFNNELVLLIETTNANLDSIYFQHQTGGWAPRSDQTVEHTRIRRLGSIPRLRLGPSTYVVLGYEKDLWVQIHGWSFSHVCVTPEPR